MSNCDVAIVGAGPYGLSVAAHLRAAKVDSRIFGSPMEFWLKHMPKGMHLKSEGFASSLSDPGVTFTLETYYREKGLPYAHIGTPVPLEVFSSYGLEFQKRFVPELENQRVTSLRQSSTGFQVTLDNAEVFTARRVVIAVGLTYYEYLPPELATVSTEFVTHSSKHSTLDHFKGREVAVVGAGASALDLASLLHQSGAAVQVVARVSKIRFHDPPANLNPSWLDQLRTPVTGIGPGWKLFLCANLPLVFRQMPARFRLERVRRILGPAPCWFIKEQVVGKVGFNLGVTITSVKVQNGRVGLQLTDNAGSKREITVDHVIAATGYKPDLRRIAFVDSGILSGIQCVEQTPVLSSNFESTVPNLYFVGVTAANTFGPLLRFSFGAGFAAPRLSKHLARTASRDFVKRQSASRTQSNMEREGANPLEGVTQTDLTQRRTNLKSEAPQVAAPRVLLTDTNRWALSARLAISLSEVGCQVSAVCPTPGHPLLKTRAVQQTFPYSGLHPLESLTAAIEAVDPDIIVPACDRGVRHLHKLYAQAKSRGAEGSKLAALIERSLGSPASHSIVSSRYEILALAREEGVRVPSISRVDTTEELESWQAQELLPWVLKADGTCGGGGVKIVHTPDQVQQALTQLLRTFRLARAIKRLLVNRDPFWLRSWLERTRHPVSVQSYIHGRPANCAVLCWNGRVLANIGVEVVSFFGLTGPASVVRIVDNAEMTFAAERIASRLGLSGFFGLDFMIEDGSGAAYLIEMNPRTTPPCHLRIGKGRDMPGALWAELTGQPLPEAPRVTENEMIAYFPQPDDSKNGLLHSCYQDVPNGEPELVQELLRPWPDTLLFRLFVRLHQGPAPATGLRTPRDLSHDQFNACQAPDYVRDDKVEGVANKG